MIFAGCSFVALNVQCSLCVGVSVCVVLIHVTGEGTGNEGEETNKEEEEEGEAKEEGGEEEAKPGIHLSSGMYQ